MKIIRFLFRTKTSFSCTVMLFFTVTDTVFRPSYSYMSGLYWLCCCNKICYMLAWLAWAYFFIRQFWSGYDDSLKWFGNVQKEDPDPDDIIQRLI